MTSEFIKKHHKNDIAITTGPPMKKDTIMSIYLYWEVITYKHVVIDTKWWQTFLIQGDQNLD